MPISCPISLNPIKSIFLSLFLLSGWVLNHALYGMEEGKFVSLSRHLIASNSSMGINPEADRLYKQRELESAEKGKQKVDEKHLQEIDAYDKALYEEAFAKAPPRLRALIEDKLRGREYAQRYTYIMLTGPTGSGKSTLARAIFFTMGMKADIIDGPSQLGRYRDQAAENVRKAFQEAGNAIVFEEMNLLADNYNSEHTDALHTAAQIWTTLDRREKEKEFFLIATGNRSKGMPHQLQKRFKGRTFFIDNPPESLRLRSLEFCMRHQGASRDETCTDAYLQELAKKATNFAQQDIRKLVDTALLLFYESNRNATKATLSKAYLEKAYEELQKEDEIFWDFSEHVTDEERRHREIMAQNKAHYEDNKETQLKSAELSLTHQAYMMSLTSLKRGISLEFVEEMLRHAVLRAFPERLFRFPRPRCVPVELKEKNDECIIQ